MGRFDPPMYEYHGRCDPNHLLRWEVSENQIEDHFHMLTRLPFKELCGEVVLQPYSMADPRPAVSCLTFVILLRPRDAFVNIPLTFCYSFVSPFITWRVSPVLCVLIIASRPLSSMR